MARLSHANVIRVYDVGVAGQTVFVAMEHIAGTTLKGWLAAAVRRSDEILAIFAQAGRGLAAAHDAGLVHRDFKPSNVLVSDDGRVLVTDFGLARAATDAEGHWIESEDSGSSPPERTVTRGGAVVGTPAYMAPEQHQKHAIDARADQFSFCVSLWRALYGAPPFAGDNLRALLASIVRGRLVEPPPSARVPAHVRVALTRGLAADPAARFPSMRALLDALGDDPLRRRRRLRAGALAVALLAAGLGAAWSLGRRVSQQPCSALGDRFAGVWDPSVRSQLHDAFVATGVPWAETTFASVARQLDRRQAAWKAMRLASCEATRVQKVQSDSMFDLRAQCLERRIRDLSVFVDGMRRVDVAAMRTAAAEAAGVADVSDCGDVSSLRRRAALPDDPQRRGAIEAVERDSAKAQALVAGGRSGEAEPGVAGLVDRARAAGYAPLLAETLAMAGQVEDRLTHLPAAEKLFSESALAADAGGDDERRFDDELSLIKVVGYERERAADGALHAERAEAILQRLGDQPRRRAGLDWNLSVQSWWYGRYDEARKRIEHGIALLERVDPNGPDLVRALHMLAITQQELKDFTGSLASEERARAIGEKVLGADHPVVAQSWETSGGTLRLMGRYDDAERHLKKGLTLVEAGSGPQSSDVASALHNLGTLDLQRDRFDEAIGYFQRADAIDRKLFGPDHSRVADIDEVLASALSQTGRKAEAEAMFERVIAIYRGHFGADSPVTASAERHFGDHYLRSGQPARAMSLYEESLRAVEASQGKKSAQVSRPLEGIARAAVALSDPARAIGAYERALAVTGADDPLHAGVAFALAKLLRPRDPGQAEALAREARALFVAQGADGADDVAKVDAWLGQRR